MKLEGKTLIELTDVNTGEVETYEDKNLVTNAIAQLFSLNPEGILYCIQGNGGVNWNEHHLPICPNAIGGILLFSDTITEDVNNLYAPSANPCVGYASNNVNSSANTLRGSLNLNESGKIENGYKFVWDFATSQANGTISAVALTHKRGGVAYMGDPYDSSNRLLCMKTLNTGVSGSRGSWYVDAVELNFEGNYFISISMDSSNKVYVRKIRKCYTQVGLNFALHENVGDYILEEHVLTPTTFLNPQASSNYGSIDFIDGKNGYWYGFIGGGNNSGNASVKWIKIKKSDYSFTEGIWTLNNTQIQQVGHRGGYNVVDLMN